MQRDLTPTDIDAFARAFEAKPGSIWRRRRRA